MNLSWDDLFTSLLYDSVWALLAVFIAYRYYRFKTRKLIPVDIDTRRGTESGTSPKVLVATFSGYPKPPEMSPQDFETALRAGDLDRLPLSTETRGMGHTVLSLLAYRDSLEEVYLVPSLQSLGSAELLRRFAIRERIPAAIHARPQETLRLDDDARVTERAHEVTRDLLLELGQKGRHARDILVDVTGGTRSMTVGSLLACLLPHQNVQVIASRYTPEGFADSKTAYPMVIEFKPDLEALDRVTRR